MTKYWRRALLQRLLIGLLVVAMGLTGCSDRPFSDRPTKLSRTPSKRFVKEIVEVPPPAAIQQMRAELEVYQPQVQILSPQAEAMLDDTQVEVNLSATDLPLFKDADLGLGPHLHLILDNRPYQAVYDTSSPVVFEDLEPGTHTLRVFASRPWHESFKNAGAYDQIKFYVFTKTPTNDADLQQPLITYSRPKGDYGAEPIMLDFYLANTPLHVIAEEDPEDDFQDWQIRGTVNGQSFTFDTWEPIYLTGFEPGLNWIKLELLNEDGDLIDNTFNGTARIIQYHPGGGDSLSKLVRGELSNDQLFQIIDPDYNPSAVTDIEEAEEPKEQEPVQELQEESQPQPDLPVELVEPELENTSEAETNSLQTEPAPEQKAPGTTTIDSPIDSPDDVEEVNTQDISDPEQTKPEIAAPEQTQNLETVAPDSTQGSQPKRGQVQLEEASEARGINTISSDEAPLELDDVTDDIDEVNASEAETFEESATAADAAFTAPASTPDSSNGASGANDIVVSGDAVENP